MPIKKEIPGVNNAVQKLEELAVRMRTDDFGFKNNDVDNIDQVIDALHELENQRKTIHDELEKATIDSSIFRHQLKLLPGQIRDEVMEAVMAARLSNANVLLELQEKLKNMNAQITALDKQARELEEENAVLHPERELLKHQHEEIISQLNQRMAEKASMQIGLNETRDKVRQANQDIVDLEDGILQLKEDLIQERTEARQEKKRLKQAVTDTVNKTRQQKDENVYKKKELDVAQEKLTDSEGKLDTVRKSIRRYETSRAKLEGEERALGAQLSNQLKMNDQMRIQGAALLNERIKEERDLKRQEQELKEKIRQFQIDIESESLRSEELTETRIDLLQDLKVKEEIMAEDADKVAELDEMLQSSKEALNTKAEEVGTMKRENIDMSEQIESLAESHKYIIVETVDLVSNTDGDNPQTDFSQFDPSNFNPDKQEDDEDSYDIDDQAVLAQLNKQIEEYREQLSKERKDRLEVQSQKESVSKNLDDLKTENQFFMTEMTNVVQEGKKQHADLSNEGLQLQRALKKDEEVITELTRNLGALQSKYESMFNDYQKRTDMMENEDELNKLRHKLAVSQEVIKALKFQLREIHAQVSDLDEDTRSRSRAHSWNDTEVMLELGISIDNIDSFMSLSSEEICAMQTEMETGSTSIEALRKVSLEGSSDEIKDEVTTLETSQTTKQQELDETTPTFEDLQDYFKQRSEEYDTIKKSIVEMKNKKQSLEEQIRRIKKEKESLYEPQEVMRKELKECRQKLMKQLQQNGGSTRSMEQMILTAGCKLRAVMEENHKFEESCRKLEEDLAALMKETEENERIKKKLRDELNMQKQELLKKWEADNMMQEFFASRDEATAEAFGRLLARTEKREGKINMITERLKEELFTLGGFLDTISSRRPPESKSSEGSLTPSNAVDAVAGANQQTERSGERPNTANTLQLTTIGSSPSLQSPRRRSDRKSQASSRQGTAHSHQSLDSSPLTPRSALKSPSQGKKSSGKSTTFADC